MKIRKLLDYLLIICIILEFNSVYLAMVNVDFRIIILICNIIISCLNIAILLKNRKVKKRKIIYLIMYAFFIIAFVFLNRIKGKLIINFLLYFLISFSLYCIFFMMNTSNEIKEFLLKFKNVILILAYTFMFFYLFSTVLKIIPNSNMVKVKWGTEIRNIKEYYGIYFEMQNMIVFGKSIYRNSGIFVEGTMNSAIMFIALIIDNLFEERKNKINNIVFLLNIITSFSTTGIIATVLFYAVMFINSKKNKRVKVLVLPVAMIIGSIFIILALSAKMDTSSYTARMDDYIACYKAWKTKPIFGCGYRDNTKIIQFMSKSRINNIGLSNSVSALLAQSGIYLGIIYFIPFLKLIFSKKIKNINIKFFTFFVFFLFATTIFTYTLLIIMLLAIGWVYEQQEDT